MKNGDTIGMSHEVLIDEELIRRQTPEAQAVIRLLLAKIAELEARIEALSGGKNPRNSSLPPSSEHPHAKPAVKEKPSGKKRGGHLKRDFQSLADSPVRVAKDLGRKLLNATKLVFRQWSRCRDGTISQAGLKSSLGTTRREIERLLARGLMCRHARTAEVCRELVWYRQRLWTFVEHAGVEPTNNAAERSLRHAVIWRKLSFGTQSAAGSRFVETLLTVIETCRQQQRDVFVFITNAVESHLLHHPAPSLKFGV